MRVQLDSIVAQVAAPRLQAGPPPETREAEVRVPADDSQTAPPERQTPTQPEGWVADTRIGKALELRLRGQALSLSRAAINAQAYRTAEETPRLRVVTEEIRGLAARAASGTLTDRERVTIERRMRILERELDTLTAYQRLAFGQASADAWSDVPAIQQVTERAAVGVAASPAAAVSTQANVPAETVLRHLWP